MPAHRAHVPRVSASLGGAKSPSSPPPACSLIDRLTILQSPIRLDPPFFCSSTPYCTSSCLHRRSPFLILPADRRHRAVCFAHHLQPLHYLYSSHTMASTMFDSAQHLYQQLEQAKADFWISNAHLTEEQRQELWSQAAFQSSNASMAQQTPRTLPSTTNMMHLPVWILLWSALSLSNSL